ncbi:MAG: glycosyltransferase, partial [Candidatus Micrarchaeia archaeon]
MACGLPVAGANFLAIPEIVKDGYNGYLFDPFDPKDCAEKIILTIKNRKKLSKGALETAKKFAIEKIQGELIEVYKEVIKKKLKRK